MKRKQVMLLLLSASITAGSIVPAYAATPEMALTTETEASVLTDEIELPESIMEESEEKATKTEEESVVENAAEDSTETPATDILTNVAPSEEAPATDETVNKPEARNMFNVTSYDLLGTDGYNGSCKLC